MTFSSTRHVSETNGSKWSQSVEQIKTRQWMTGESFRISQIANED